MFALNFPLLPLTSISKRLMHLIYILKKQRFLLCYVQTDVLDSEEMVEALVDVGAIELLV